MYEHSYGVIPVRWHSNQWELFLVQHRAGHWAFPKGHPEKGESPKETAVRELKEETGLSIVRFLTEDTFYERYHFQNVGRTIEKKVTYFLAEVENRPIILQKEELKSGLWLSLEAAEKQLTFSEGRRVCRQAAERLRSLGFRR